MTYTEKIPAVMIERINRFFSGYKSPYRRAFDRLAEMVYSINANVKLIVHTKYVIFVEPNSDEVFVSVHFLDRAMYVGFSLPETYQNELLVPGDMLRYKGITKALSIASDADVNEHFAELVQEAIRYREEKG